MLRGLGSLGDALVGHAAHGEASTDVADRAAAPPRADAGEKNSSGDHRNDHAPPAQQPAEPGPEAWVSDYRPGSDADFSRLYEREALPLTRTVFAIAGSRQEAEDCVQEAFVRAYKKWPSWQPTAPARFWVQRIAINLAISRRRTERLVAIRNRVLARSVPAPDKGAEHLDLVGALRRLPVKQLVAVLLRFNHGYNNREIAQTLGISERAVGQRVQSALDGLRVLLDDAVTA